MIQICLIVLAVLLPVTGALCLMLGVWIGRGDAGKPVHISKIVRPGEVFRIDAVMSQDYVQKPYFLIRKDGVDRVVELSDVLIPPTEEIRSWIHFQYVLTKDPETGCKKESVAFAPSFRGCDRIEYSVVQSIMLEVERDEEEDLSIAYE